MKDFKQKILLVILGIFLTFVVIEILLRIGGFIAFLYQESNNVFSRWYKRDYTVLCLGESTTAAGYPRKLEEILNKNKENLQFTVINKGWPGIDSFGILSRLAKYMEEYQPDFVVTMMGINDKEKTKLFVEGEEGYSGNRRYPLRIIKLVESLKQHIAYKYKEKPDEQETIVRFQRIKEKIGNNQWEKAYEILLDYYSNIKGYKRTEKPPFKEINLDPQNPFGHFILGRYYYGNWNCGKAQEEYQKCLEFIDRFPARLRKKLIIDLMICYILSEEDKKVKEFIKIYLGEEKIIGVLGYYVLGKAYLYLDEAQEAEATFKKAIEKAPIHGPSREYIIAFLV